MRQETERSTYCKHPILMAILLFAMLLFGASIFPMNTYAAVKRKNYASLPK